MNQAYIKTEYSEDLSPQAFAALTGILLNARKASMAEDWVCTSPLIVSSVLTGKEPTDSELQAITKGFRELSALGLVEKYRGNSGYYRVNYSGIERKDEKYVCLEESEVRAILNAEKRINHLSLLLYFAYLKSTFDFETKVGSYPLTYLSEGSNKSVITINKYHGVLEELGVLKIFRFRPSKNADGDLIYQKNVYCLPDNVEEALRFIHEEGKLSNLKNVPFSGSESE